MLAENLFGKIGFTDKMISDFERYDKLIGKECRTLADDFMSGKIDIYQARKVMDELATEEVSNHTYYLLSILHSTAALLESYRKEGISDEMFYETMKDIRYKLTECDKVCGVYGIQSNSFLWYNGFFKEFRHAFGRLQFDRMKYEGEPIERAGCVLFDGDFCLNCHIPSSGPLKHEQCIESYKLAYEFFKDKLIDGILPVLCHSWLLYPQYADVFGRSSNVCKFASDYRIFNIENTGKFSDCWRVFNCDYDGDVNKLPNKTSMQRAFINYIENGGGFGVARGILFFDGEKVLTKNQYTL